MTDLFDAQGRRSVRWCVSGRVQGVGFRWFVKRAASRLDVGGDVCNLRDGRVEIRARGTAAALEALLDQVRVGPGGSRVDRVEVLQALTPAEGEGFTVRGEGG